MRMRLFAGVLVSVLIGLGLYHFSTTATASRGLLDSLASISLHTWIAVLTLSLINYGLRYWRWKAAIQRLQAPGTQITAGLCEYLSGLAFTTTPGKAGELARGFFLVRHNIPHSHNIASFAYERMLDLLVIVLLSALVLTRLPQYRWLLLVAALLIIAVISILARGQAGRLCQLLARRPFLRTPAQKMVALLDASAPLWGYQALLSGLGLGLAAWFAEGIGLFLILDELTGQAVLSREVGIYSIGILAGALSMLPGGLGGTEVVMTGGLLAAAYTLEHATIATLVCRVATLWFAVLLGVFASVYLLAMSRKLDEHKA